MLTKLNTLNINFDSERQKKKSFGDIFEGLEKLQSDLKKNILKTSLSTQVMIKLSDPNKGIKITSNDKIQNINNLLPSWIKINFNSELSNLNTGDTIFIKNNKLFIKKDTGNHINIGTINGYEENIVTTNYTNTKKDEKETSLKNENLSNNENKENEIDIKNKTIVELFNNFYEKHPLSFVSKKELLIISDNNYYVATVILMIHLNEQGEKGDINFRRILKKAVPFWVRSKGEFQIRYMESVISNNNLKIFFSNYEHTFGHVSFLTTKDKKLYFKLKKEFNKKGELTDEQRKELLNNLSLSTIMVTVFAKERFDRVNHIFTKDYNVNLAKRLNKKSKNSQFVFLSTIAEAYHKGPSWGIKVEPLINETLKIGEKSGMIGNLKNGWRTNYQESVRQETSGTLGITGASFYQRGKKLFTETVDNLYDYYKNNKRHLLYKLRSKGYKNPEQEYSKIMKGLRPNNRRFTYTKLSMFNIPKELQKSLETLKKVYDVNFMDFTIEDYLNSNSDKAMLVGNYGPSSWYKMTKKT